MDWPRLLMLTHNGDRRPFFPLTVTGSTQDSHLIPFYPCIVTLWY